MHKSHRQYSIKIPQCRIVSCCINWTFWAKMSRKQQRLKSIISHCNGNLDSFSCKKEKRSHMSMGTLDRYSTLNWKSTVKPLRPSEDKPKGTFCLIFPSLSQLWCLSNQVCGISIEEVEVVTRDKFRDRIGGWAVEWGGQLFHSGLTFGRFTFGSLLWPKPMPSCGHCGAWGRAVLYSRNAWDL